MIASVRRLHRRIWLAWIVVVAAAVIAIVALQP